MWYACYLFLFVCVVVLGAVEWLEVAFAKHPLEEAVRDVWNQSSARTLQSYSLSQGPNSVLTQIFYIGNMRKPPELLHATTDNTSRKPEIHNDKNSSSARP